MYSVVVQDWVTIRGASSVTSITQGENGWIGTAAYEDIVFWLDVREVSLSGATSVNVNYQTSPLKDDYLFTNMMSGVAITAALTTPTVTKVLLSQNPTCPLARWVRWNLSVVGTATASWDMTFRILAACNAVGQITQ